MAKLIIDLSGKGGLAPRFWGDIDKNAPIPELRVTGSETQMADGIYNPFRRYGYVSPANATSESITFTGGTLDALMGSSIYDAVNDDFYFAERGEQIFKGDGGDDTELAQSLDLGASGTPVIMDLEIYQLNGAKKLFYIYETGGNLEVGEANLPFASANSNWLSTDTTNNFTDSITNEAFMRVANDGFAYIFADNKVHKLDGTSSGGANGTVTKSVLTLPTTFQVTDAVDYRNNMYIATMQSTVNIRTVGETERVFNTECGVLIWDRRSSVISVRDFIPVGGVKEIRNIYISPEGDLRLITVNTERTAEIRQFNGRTFVTIQELGIVAYPQFHDSMTQFSGLTTWLGRDGIIYAHGKVTHNDADGLYKIGKFTVDTTGTPTGAILLGGSNNASTSGEFKTNRVALYIAYVTSSTNTMKTWDIYGTGADNVTALQLQGDVFTLVKYLPTMSTVRHIDLYMVPGSGSGTTTAGTVKIYFNQSTTAFASKTIDYAASALGYKRFEINKPYVNAVQLEIEFPSADAIGTTDFAPAFAVVDYEPTETKG